MALPDEVQISDNVSIVDSPFAENLDHVRQALESVNISAPSVNKFHRLDEVLAAAAGLSRGAVTSVTISKPGNFSVRSTQSPRAQQASLLVGVCVDEGVMEDTKDAARKDVLRGGHQAVILMHESESGTWGLGWGVRSSDERTATTATKLSNAYGIAWEIVQAEQPHVEASSTTAPSMQSVPARLVIDDRTLRMVRTSIASRSATMLVGPPGTGKTQLIEEVVREVAQTPASFGMSMAHDRRIVTPDESWTTRDLLGGDTVDDKGRIRFAIGHLLEAVSRDEWLVLDEANRADMDRIFGGALTWLSGQAVSLGRVSADPNAGEISLGWTESVMSEVTQLDELMADSPIEPVEFLAGAEWRLLGTYNALDAVRVFRFGQALGRRFAHVPIAPPDSLGFDSALAAELTQVPPEIRSEVRTRVVTLYAAHRAKHSTALGPALFLGIPRYVASGIGLGHGTVAELVAEAYVTSSGAWLARIDDSVLDALGAALSTDEGLEDQWSWVTTQLQVLR
ncbi:AAA family ATPase [Microbacterium yannicii]|uniref:AAA family ATPase n=1 Tax=Microbacterium yannicii TaxID=671622 RepID=UPI0002E801A0|nr:AAA family ATPase [Microbacterium yannicii]